MANQNIQALIEFTVNQMKSEFANSKKIFEDNGARNGLIHSGEFGAFRERIVSKFLKLILPPTYDVGTGFIITPNEQHSTQCDVLIYDKDSTTLFTDPDNARLFPVETIVGFCEVKSNIGGFSELKNIINKIHSITKLRHNMDVIDGVRSEASKTRVNLNGRNIFKMIDDYFESSQNNYFLDRRCLNSMYYNKETLGSEMVSLLICNKIEVADMGNMLNELNSYYKEINFAPCAILSLQDGIILHINNINSFVPYFHCSGNQKLTQFNTSLKLFDTSNADGVFNFINIFRQAVIMTKTFEFDIVKYIKDYFK